MADCIRREDDQIIPLYLLELCADVFIFSAARHVTVFSRIIIGFQTQDPPLYMVVFNKLM